MAEAAVGAADFKLLEDQSLEEMVESMSGRPKGLSPAGRKEWDRLGSLCMEPDHLGEVVVFFCHDCSKSGCSICCMKDHYQHKKTYMDLTGMDEGAFGHTGIFFPSEFTLEGLFKKLNEDLQGIDIRAENAKDQIRACVDRHKVNIETNKKKLVDHVNAVKKARLKHLQEQQKQLRKNLDWLISIVLFTNQHFDSDDPFSLLLAEKEITRRVAELNEKCCKVSLPSERDWNLDKIKVIKDGKYVQANQSQKHSTTSPHPDGSMAKGGAGDTKGGGVVPGMRTIHDSTFKAASVKVGFEMEPAMIQEFVKVCCQELGEKYRLKVKREETT